MKKFAVAILALLALAPIPASADESVRGYTRKDGTYVEPHMRSNPNRSYNDNWSTNPNVNPYTGERGTRAPTFDDRPPPRDSYGSSGGSRSGGQRPRY